MNWNAIKSILGDAAPLIGAVVAGPAGATTGKLLAATLGVDESPEAVAKAITNDPSALLKVRELELTHQLSLQRLTLEAETTQLSEINQTMRAELTSDGWFRSGWRPFIGWVTGLSFAGLMLALVFAIFSTPDQASRVIDSATVIISLMLAVLGINISKRSADKRALLGAETDSILSAISKRIKKS